MIRVPKVCRRTVPGRPGRSRSRAAWLLAAAMATWGGFGVARVTAAERTLVVAAATFPDSLLTGISTFTSTSLLMQTFDPLVARTNKGDYVPALAESWEPAGDTAWRFHLRRGVKFHDGHDFTAEDVKFTFDRILDPKTAYGFAGRISQVSGVRIVDSYTIEFTTKGTFPILPKAVADMPVEPKHYYEKEGADAARRHPIGTGPFVFKTWTAGDRYELTANPAYWGGAPKVDRLLIRQVPEAATRVAALLSGEAQIAEEIPIDVLEQIELSKAATIASIPTTVGLVLTFDPRKAPFDDPKVREALDMAIDKDLILKEILKGKGEVLDGQLLTKATFGYDPSTKARPYDPERAKALLKEAKFDFKTPVTITTQSGKYVSDVDICNAIAGMLQEIGVKASVSVLEGGVFLKQWNAKEMGPLYMVGWYSLGDADFATVWYTEAGRRTTWVNPEYETLFSEARGTNDIAVRARDYGRMMQILHTETPSIFLFGLPSLYGVSGKISGFEAASDKILRLKDVVMK